MYVQFQAERLSEFYEICKSIDIGRGERFIKIEQVVIGFIVSSNAGIALFRTLKRKFIELIFFFHNVAPSIFFTSHGRVCQRCSPGFNSSQGSGVTYKSYLSYLTVNLIAD